LPSALSDFITGGNFRRATTLAFFASCHIQNAPSDLARATWREHVESAHEVVIYVGEPEFDPWTGECAAQADLVLLAMGFVGPEAEGMLKAKP